MPDLLDASVWVPLSAPDHVHYRRAREYWDTESDDTLVFCRLTTLALLRHLTNPRIMGRATLDGAQAWKALRTWLEVPRVRLEPEPVGIDACLEKWSGCVDLRAGAWTDAYLAAFAVAGGYRLVAFDTGYSRYPGLSFFPLRA